MRTKVLFIAGAFGAAALVGGFPVLAASQVGDISNVNYPGWIPADRAAPLVFWWVDYDQQRRRRWRLR